MCVSWTYVLRKYVINSFFHRYYFHINSRFCTKLIYFFYDITTFYKKDMHFALQTYFPKQISYEIFPVFVDFLLKFVFFLPRIAWFIKTVHTLMNIMWEKMHFTNVYLRCFFQETILYELFPFLKICTNFCIIVYPKSQSPSLILC